VAKKQIIEYISVGIAVLIPAMGFFIRYYFARTRKDIEIEILFELLRDKDTKCSKHGERLASLEAKVK
jgi:hypothetical protein